MSEPAGLEPATAPPPARPQGGPTVLRILLGFGLRRLREERGITAEDAGYAIRGSQSKISRMEMGRIGFKERDVADLLTLYGVDDEEEREQLLAMSRQANTPGWWRQFADVLPQWFETYVGLEEAASRIRTYEVSLVPGLLQTEAYARAVARLAHPDADSAEIERRVDLLMRRQRNLIRPDGPSMWFVLDEAVLRRPLGGPEVMRAQIEHLAEVIALSNLSVQIVPFRAGAYAGTSVPFTVLRFGSPDLLDVVYLELASSALYLDRRGDVEIYVGIMNRLAVEAPPPADTKDFLRELLAEPR